MGTTETVAMHAELTSVIGPDPRSPTPIIPELSIRGQPRVP